MPIPSDRLFWEITPSSYKLLYNNLNTFAPKIILQDPTILLRSPQTYLIRIVRCDEKRDLTAPEIFPDFKPTFLTYLKSSLEITPKRFASNIASDLERTFNFPKIRVKLYSTVRWLINKISTISLLHLPLATS